MGNDTTVDAPERPREHRENRKKNLGRKVATNQAMAVAKYVRVPPRKARLVMDEVRGMYATDALNFLRFIPNRAAVFISKVLTSAMANAANNHNLNPDHLKLVEARVDEGPRIKRIRARAQGRAYRILRRTSHLTVILEEVGPKPRKPRATKGQPGSRAQAARAAREAAAAPLTPPTAATAPPEETPAPPADVTPSAPLETVAAVEPVAEQLAAPVEADTGAAPREDASASATEDATTPEAETK